MAEMSEANATGLGSVLVCIRDDNGFADDLAFPEIELACGSKNVGALRGQEKDADPSRSPEQHRLAVKKYAAIPPIWGVLRQLADTTVVGIRDGNNRSLSASHRIQEDLDNELRSHASISRTVL